jgi:hypothetical protein
VAATAAVLCFSTPVFAQTTAPGLINVTATINAKAKLTLGAGSISFADADPDAFTSVTAGPVTVDVKTRTSAAGVVTLTVLADGDLVSGGNSIGIGNLSWSATGAGFQAGTASKTVATTVGSWTGGGTPSGGQTFALVNSWTYATGSYTLKLNYTLSAP